jgi:hypothetical protein
MAKKKVLLRPSKRKELEGFEEVLDLVYGKDTQVVARSRRDLTEDYQIYDFLEKENHRLQKLDRLYSDILKTEQRFSQIEKLLIEQEENLAVSRDTLSKVLNDKNSPMNSQLQKIFDTAFNH